ncbi:MAG: type II toxin-antitoxin system VapC family toxin [Acidobacteriaceae bacterium]|nr:type II toxin-antitoxin system VapC family toxin [Acidobacteriaceae bacterium]MBV9780972.1 type II toxin-antitoxin system VapC family toxin [Acidobacteriaceae bacterium]
MILVDVNVLVYGFRADAPGHSRYLSWWKEQAASRQAFGLADLVLSGFLRIVTHPRIFNPPSQIESALRFAETLKRLPNYVEIRPGPRHWDIFVSLCRTANARGNLVPDAFLAALAIESGSEWITTDRDYGRFPDLQWRHPLE